MTPATASMKNSEITEDEVQRIAEELNGHLGDALNLIQGFGFRLPAGEPDDAAFRDHPGPGGRDAPACGRGQREA